MVLLESELTRLFQKCRLSGSMFITLHEKGLVEGFEPLDNKCLLRATEGKKISTVVSSKEVNKANVDGLKKTDEKSKSKRSKAAQ
ncbi:unnamed protein product [Nyctereutes procyonoides]|uniref:Signal recognition particle 14 kDa protein n=1 Tax=Nyctereutes procyonoides TaxID=34880 RepID=A0A811YNI2_NYCPR|nr:unnamed protein product [Nyctereutes procyonoides]